MSEIADTGHPRTALNVVHESYAFACMRCGHGWEQSYEIEHHVDAGGQEYVVYRADGHHVPSPLSRPTCLNCGGHVVRIMRAGQVSSVLDTMRRQYEAGRGETGSAGATEAGARGAGAVTVPGPGPVPVTEAGGRGHHWHLSDLLHPFQHRKAR
ncbi:hypothetical protein [Streptomyces alboniger]|uniref:C2H2-type domain-containing protein n=1 Tax=Streptomyces alboniger TaxID=132473 RepID=A0A5J6HJI9_STRAD|nr:hypothetical protein [Streptomyces alboniger]QEV18540.1 hypothetical protein CP975_14510 [Streptomyces alboniger]